LGGAQYLDHAGIVPADLYADPEGQGHEAIDGILAVGEKINYREEWYYYQANPRGQPGVTVLLTVDGATIAGGSDLLGNDHPIGWIRDYGGSRFFMYTGFHTDEAMNEQVLRQHVYQGLLYLAGYTGCMDPAYAEYNEKATRQGAASCLSPAGGGCMDVRATNYDPLAIVACDSCCIYEIGTSRRLESGKSIVITAERVSISDHSSHTIEVRSAKGRIMDLHRGEGTADYSLSQLERGLYFIRVTTPHRTVLKRVLRM
jgi:hypothetical protein